MEKLKGVMECPVCLSVPVEVPVPCCPVGHIICKSCLSSLRRAGMWNCPTCRLRIGNTHQPAGQDASGEHGSQVQLGGV